MAKNKKILCRHYYTARIKNWKWNPETNHIDECYEDVEKDFSSQQLKDTLSADKWAIFGYFILGLVVGCIGFMGTWISGLIFMGVSGFIGLVCGSLQYYLDHYKGQYRYDLGEQDGFMEDSKLQYIFLEEIAQRYESKLKQEKLAERWRKKHPLEEKVRMAMTGNPNYVAQLLLYCELVKSHSDLKKHIDKTSNNIKDDSNNEITVKYLNPTVGNNKNRGKK